MEGILFWEDRLLKIGCLMEGILFWEVGCLMEGISFWEDRVLNGRYSILGR